VSFVPPPVQAVFGLTFPITTQRLTAQERNPNQSHQLGNAMSKGKKRSNREAKKPKAVKPKEPVVSSFAPKQTKTKFAPNVDGKKKTF
jgi:hypothetical protein